MFGIEIFDAPLILASLVAFAAGILSFLSPCVLPIVPPYLAYMTGASMNDLSAPESQQRKHAFLIACFFVLGLWTVFFLLGAAASSFGRNLLQYQEPLSKIAGIIIIIFGLHFLDVFRIGFLNRDARLSVDGKPGTPLGAYLFGLAFAFGWTPCIGPVLAAILSLAAQVGSGPRAVILMASYALGLGLPFILAAAFLPWFLKFSVKLKKHMGVIEKLIGCLLILVGITIFSGSFSRFSFWLLETFPILSSVG